MPQDRHAPVPRATPSDVVVVGGCGHVGLPLSVALAGTGLAVTALDIDDAAVRTVNGGELPFLEPAALQPMRDALADGTFRATTDASVVADAGVVVMVIGTPVDEHLNPDPSAVGAALAQSLPYLHDGQLLVLRSTVYPGVTASIERQLDRAGLDIDVAFCPERIAEGRAMTELYTLPQLVGARTDRSRKRATALFERLTATIVPVSPEEAELAKLFTNTWRYLKFAAANQFYVMANDHGVDYERVRAAIVQDYPRAADLPSAGFAAGPCLLKDTMQLAAFADNSFVLGHAAMLVNEGLPMYVVSRLEQRLDLADLTVGILGMAFKAESDDVRESLSYKLRRLLQFRTAQVLCTDPYVRTDPSLVPLDDVVSRADVLIIAAPHPQYRELATDKEIVDVWGLRGEGTLV
ncbi:nucleotide sugar dehydrogenase [Jatrophihabitans endophyticus]|uniref:nucleotide sugar dehydrogenase n=1 Tax=Jatrophihabitans endophyticus TaxID=1206085 RepID=UPI00190E5F8A|nr:nucleotide sugar dehydrogenase [Jatrophihabitans endophyticus]